MIPSPEAVFARVADRPGAAWLDGGDGGGWSILAWDPVEIVTEAAGWPAAGRHMTRRRAAADLPFAGGVLGYLGYGAGHAVAPVPAEAPTPEPPVWLARYDGGLCFRHADRTWHLGGSDRFRAEAAALLEDPATLPSPGPPPVRPARTVAQADHEAAVRRILDWLAAGDCYQVNLTRPVHVDGVDPDPWRAYRRLRATSPAAYGAYLRLEPSLAVLSNSPELFVEVDGPVARCRPIKGTRPRHPDPAADRALAEALRRSDKDLAELTMIVDLVRNDLGRLAVAGTVRAEPRAVTAHANVHHASQDVVAALKPGVDGWDVLAATFPPGSVTGAPKVRACQRIAELEPEPRGVYCGAIGYVADGGRACWSVAIRTAVQDGRRLRYHVGGGVVIASDPSDEWEETVAKGRALAAALHGG